MMDLDIGVVQDVEKRQKKRLLLDYLADNLKHHNWWAYRYFFCEFLALVNIIGEFTDRVITFDIMYCIKKDDNWEETSEKETLRWYERSVRPSFSASLG